MASPFNIVTCSRLGLRNLPVWAWALWTLKVHKIFTKAGRGPLVKRILCLRPAGVINCRLSFWASWFPRGFCSNMGGCCKPRGSPNSFLSAIWGQILFCFFFVFLISQTGSSSLYSLLGAPVHFWRFARADGYSMHVYWFWPDIIPSH